MLIMGVFVIVCAVSIEGFAGRSPMRRNPIVKLRFRPALFSSVVVIRLLSAGIGDSAVILMVIMPDALICLRFCLTL
jgi:hypothetical protein